MAGKRKLRAAVIGLGMGKKHLEAYLNNPNVEVAAICDSNKKILKKAQNEYHISVTAENYAEIISRQNIDLVSIASPDHCHKEQCLAALTAGKYVLCEKPLALTEKDCNEIITAAHQAKSKFMVGQICRYTPAFKLARKIITENGIGELFFVESEYCHNYGNAAGVDQWRKSKTHLRHPFLGGACHAVDLLRWIGGEVTEVFAYSSHKTMPDWPVDDFTIALTKHENNVIGKVTCSIGCVRPYTMRSVFYGSRGTIICDNETPVIKLCNQSFSLEKNFNFASIPVEVCSHNIDLEIAEFVNAVINDKPVFPGPEEGAKTVSVCLAAVASAKAGKPVKL